MKSIIKIILLLIGISSTTICFSQPNIPVEQWKGKTILLIGAHPDDDHQSHGTLALLNSNGNDIYIVTMTTGNVGTKDPKLSKTDLAKIRRQEEVDALKEIGISEDHYINLGYDDGRLELLTRKKQLANWYIIFVSSNLMYCYLLIRASTIKFGTKATTEPLLI